MNCGECLTIYESLTIYDDNSFSSEHGDFYPSPKNYCYSFTEDKVVTITVSLFRGKNTWESVVGHRAYLYYIENGKPAQKDLSLKEECEALHIKEEINHQSLSYTVTKTYKLTVKKGTGYFVVDLPDELGDQTTGNGTNAKIYMLVKYDNGMEEKRESEGAGVRIKEVNFYDSLFEKYLHSCDVVYIFVGRTDLIDVNVVKTTGIRLIKLV